MTIGSDDIIVRSTKQTMWIVASAIIVINLVVHFLTSTNYELHRDEMLYFNMADHLAPGYATVPPMTGIFAWFAKAIFGYSVFGIRFFPAILGGLSIFLMARFIIDLNGGMWALVIALVSYTLSAGFLLINSVLTPNVIEQVIWLAITYMIFSLIRTGNMKLWLWIGLLCGLGFLTKYSILALIIGLAISLIFSQHRNIFKSGYFLAGLVIAVLVMFPNIVWQFRHNLPVISHMDELNKTQLVNMNWLFFFQDLFTYNLLFTIVWVFGLTALLFARQEKKYRFIGYASVIVILLFLFAGGKGYYMLGIVPALFAFGGFTMEKYLTGKLGFIKPAYLSLAVLTSFPAIPYGLPVLEMPLLARYSEITGYKIPAPFMRWEDGKERGISQVYADANGWRELAGHASKAYGMLTREEQSNCVIYCQSNYGFAGAIHFYGKEFSLPEPITFIESYIFWAPDHIPNGAVIYVHNEAGGMVDLFNDILEVGSVGNIYARERGVKVFLCQNPKVNVDEAYHEMAMEKKQKYQ